MTEKAQFDIPLVLPGVADAADACVERIIGRLRPRAGVDEVHVLPATPDQPAKLCIHYDPDALSLSTVRAEVSAAGAEIANQYGHLIWQIAGLHARRARTIGDRLAQLGGISAVVWAFPDRCGPLRLDALGHWPAPEWRRQLFKR